MIQVLLNNKKLMVICCCSMFMLPENVAASRPASPDTEADRLIKELSVSESAEPIRNHPRWRKPQSIIIGLTKRDMQVYPDLMEYLQEVAGDVELIGVPITFSTSPGKTVMQDMEAYLGWCTQDILANSPNIRYIQNYGIGVDRCTFAPAFKDRDFILTNTRRLSGPSMAEHVIAMMFSLTRNLYHFHEARLQKNWDRSVSNKAPMIEIGGKTVLVAGLGGIGYEVAKRANALGMRVIATRNSNRDGPDFVEYVGLSDELYELAGQADVIVNALPLTEKTKGIFNKTFFEHVKQGSYFISVGRGQHVINADIIDALNNKILAGAALDVVHPEPLPGDNPLWDAKNLIITPHISSRSKQFLKRRWPIIRENLRRYINGDKLLNVVDMEKGY